MNNIDAIVIHCSASKEGCDLTAEQVTQMHIKNGFRTIGYHYFIKLDGTIEVGRPESMEGAHCNTKGFSGLSYNKHSIGICYAGGLDKNGKFKDTRTEAQKKSMHELVKKLCDKYPIKEVIGHRDTSPDINKNGVIEPFEWIKGCPCFDVIPEFSKYVK